VQHEFRLGSDLTEAHRREQRLRELWERIEAVSATADPTWDELSSPLGRCSALSRFSSAALMSRSPISARRRTSRIDIPSW
jgi:hypothetical protein